ncbi:hypothetical protein GCK72_024543 [Caenorhabditis remanei]|uniref:Uncharacterized protein n=1 Tax=Caenorhabditis remanei TaxID=31234 RepID=A0A6A5FZH9_CAERE|nr:hypothetical protein GCK72_024543 [Caenorhabditis remanei]KAF1748076.1 hypothetical protein GCK72_024543 [Caenorhabditis remanei]
MGKVGDVVRRDTSNRDTSVLGQVDRVLLDEFLDLLLVDAGEAEHSNLVGDVLPVAGGSLLGEQVLELGSHGDDTISHQLDVSEPLFVESWVREDARSNTSSVDWWVRVEWTDEDLHLGSDTSGFVGIRESHVLGKGLGKDDVVSLLNEVSDGEGIVVDISRSKSLVGHVEEDEQVTLLNNVGDLLPLLARWIDSSWVVSTSVEQDGSTFWNLSNVGKSSGLVESTGRLVVVAVLLDINTSKLEDWNVVSPGWSWLIDDFALGVLGQEFRSNSESTGSRDTLGGENSLVVDNLRVLSKGELSRELGELWETCREKKINQIIIFSLLTNNTSILLVEIGSNHLTLGFLDRWENEWLSLIVTISSDSKIDLLWVRIRLVSLSDSKNRIRWAHLDVRPPRLSADSSGEKLLGNAHCCWEKDYLKENKYLEIEI